MKVLFFNIMFKKYSCIIYGSEEEEEEEEEEG